MKLNLQDVYESILKENKNGWQEAPDSLGWWWFYGDMTYGAILNEPAKKELHCVPIMHKDGPTYISPYKGMFWYIRPYDPNNKNSIHGREGYVGYWKKCDLPSLPEWSLGYD